MKDDVRIRLRMEQLQPGQSAEFSTRVFTPISAEGYEQFPLLDDQPPAVPLTVNDYLKGGVAYCGYSNGGANEYEDAEQEPLDNLGIAVTEALREVDSEHPQRVHYATQKIERRFSTAMSSEIKGVHSTLSITVYRVK